MDRQEIKNAVIATLTEIQVKSGRPLNLITDNTRPLQDLYGFESLNAVEASHMLSSQLGCKISYTKSLFGKDVQPLTVNETVDKLISIVQNQSKGLRRKS